MAVKDNITQLKQVSSSFIDEEEEDYGREGVGTLSPYEQQTILIEETQGMENQRRQLEQKGHGRFGRVNASERSELQQTQGNELSAEAGPKEHPFLNSQRFDGIDPSLNPAPDIGTEARREFDNERREQANEKQLRLGNMPTNNKRYTPGFNP